MNVPLPERDGAARCRHEVGIVMHDDEAVMGGRRADLEVDDGERLMCSLLRGAPLQSSDPGSCGLGDGGVRVELVEHPAVRLVLLEVPRGSQELRPLGIAALDVALDRRLPPPIVEPRITEDPPEGGGVQEADSPSERLLLGAVRGLGSLKVPVLGELEVPVIRRRASETLDRDVYAERSFGGSTHGVH